MKLCVQEKKQGIQAAWVERAVLAATEVMGFGGFFFPHWPVDSLILKKLLDVERSQKLGAAIWQLWHFLPYSLYTYIMCVLFTFHPLQIKSKSPAAPKRMTIRGVNMVTSLSETRVTRQIRGGPVLLWEVWGLLFHVAGARGTWQGSYHPATVGWISLNNISFKRNTARWANCVSTLCSQMQRTSWIWYKNWGAECFLVTNSNFP